MIRGVGTALQVLSIILTVGFALVVTSRFFQDVKSSHSRGRLASGLVVTQLEELASLQKESEERLFKLVKPSGQHRGPGPGPSNDARSLRAMSFWLATSLATGKDPDQVAIDLQKVTADSGRASGRISGIVNRWTRTLRNWSSRNSELRSSGDPDAMLLEDGRVRYHRVIGYRRIGKESQSVPVAFWAIHLLNEYMKRNPLSAQVPEALFMAGDLMLGLKDTLPPDLRAYRILHLCEELYPETIWASEAAWRWRREVTQDAI